MDTTLLYGLTHFLHVVGALGLAAAFSVEAAGLIGLRRAIGADEARLWLRTRLWVLLLGPPSIALVLLTGIYLMAAAWGPDPWILVSLVSLVGIAVIGGLLTGIPMSRLTPAVESAVGTISEELRRALRTPILVVSIMTRIATTGGIVYLMVEKPALPSSILAVLLAAAIGTAAGFFVGRRVPRSTAVRRVAPPDEPQR
jgi:hypothetical protein